MPPIGGYYPTGPGPGPLTPEQSEAMIKQVVAAFKVAFPDPAEFHKGEITAIKNELNALNLAVNGIKGEVNIVSAQTDLVRLESKPLFDLQEHLAGKKGERPDQIKAEAAAAQKRADDAHQLAQNAGRRANQIDSGLQRLATGRVVPMQQSLATLRPKVNQIDSAVQRLATGRVLPMQQSLATLKNQVTQRAAAIGRDVTAALQGVRRVGGDLNNTRNQLTRRITVVERKQQAAGRTGGGQDAAALRREGDRTRQAVRDLTNAMRGAGPGSQQFKRQLDAIEQSLR